MDTILLLLQGCGFCGMRTSTDQNSGGEGANSATGGGTSLNASIKNQLLNLQNQIIEDGTLQGPIGVMPNNSGQGIKAQNSFRKSHHSVQSNRQNNQVEVVKRQNTNLQSNNTAGQDIIKQAIENSQRGGGGQPTINKTAADTGQIQDNERSRLMGLLNSNRGGVKTTTQELAQQQLMPSQTIPLQNQQEDQQIQMIQNPLAQQNVILQQQQQQPNQQLNDYSVPKSNVAAVQQLSEQNQKGPLPPPAQLTNPQPGAVASVTNELPSNNQALKQSLIDQSQVQSLQQQQPLPSKYQHVWAMNDNSRPQIQYQSSKVNSNAQHMSNQQHDGAFRAVGGNQDQVVNSVDIDRNFQTVNDGAKIDAQLNPADTHGIQSVKNKQEGLIANGVSDGANMKSQAVSRVKNDLRKLI